MVSSLMVWTEWPCDEICGGGNGNDGGNPDTFTFCTISLRGSDVFVIGDDDNCDDGGSSTISLCCS